MPHVGCCNHKFNLDMKSMIETIIGQHHKLYQANNDSGKGIEKIYCNDNIDGSTARDSQ